MKLAMALAAHGVPGFPVRVYPVGDRWRKEPHIKDWAARATTDKAKIEEWWRCWPEAMVGVPLERVGLVVIDCDRHGDGQDGVAALREIDLPPHQAVTTMSGGEHHFFQQPDPPIRSAYWSDGEVLGNGRFVVAYALAPFITLAPVLTRDLLERLPEVRAAKGNDAPLIQPTHGPQMAVAGEIPKPLYSEVHRLVPLSSTVTRHHRRRVIGILRDIVMARHELRNDGLNVAAYCFRGLIPPVSRDAAERLLLLAAQMNGYVAKDGERAAMATIRSGLGPLIGGPCVCLTDEGLLEKEERDD
jgi:Bifunctional DNA primase/polymerase, N-terminal